MRTKNCSFHKYTYLENWNVLNVRKKYYCTIITVLPIIFLLSHGTI